MPGSFSARSIRKITPIATVAVLAGVLIAASLIHSSGCATIGLPETDSTHVALASQRWHGTTAAELEKGRSAYIDRCSGCHGLYAPGNYTEKQWDTLLPVMQKRARASKEERAWMDKYVRIHAKQLGS